MIEKELKPCPFCGKTPVLEIIGRSWVRLTTTCDDACLLHNKEFDYSLSEENRQLLIDDWIRRTPQDNWIQFDYIEEIEIKGQDILLFDGEDFHIDYVDCESDYGAYFFANGTRATHWKKLEKPDD